MDFFDDTKKRLNQLSPPLAVPRQQGTNSPFDTAILGFSPPATTAPLAGSTNLEQSTVNRVNPLASTTTSTQLTPSQQQPSQQLATGRATRKTSGSLALPAVPDFQLPEPKINGDTLARAAAATPTYAQIQLAGKNDLTDQVKQRFGDGFQQISTASPLAGSGPMQTHFIKRDADGNQIAAVAHYAYPDGTSKWLTDQGGQTSSPLAGGSSATPGPLHNYTSPPLAGTGTRTLVGTVGPVTPPLVGQNRQIQNFQNDNSADQLVAFYDKTVPAKLTESQQKSLIHSTIRQASNDHIRSILAGGYPYSQDRPDNISSDDWYKKQQIYNAASAESDRRMLSGLNGTLANMTDNGHKKPGTYDYNGVYTNINPKVLDSLSPEMRQEVLTRDQTGQSIAKAQSELDTGRGHLASGQGTFMKAQADQADTQAKIASGYWPAYVDNTKAQSSEHRAGANQKNQAATQLGLENKYILATGAKMPTAGMDDKDSRKQATENRKSFENLQKSFFGASDLNGEPLNFGQATEAAVYHTIAQRGGSSLQVGNNTYLIDDRAVAAARNRLGNPSQQQLDEYLTKALPELRRTGGAAHTYYSNIYPRGTTPPGLKGTKNQPKRLLATGGDDSYGN